MFHQESNGLTGNAVTQTEWHSWLPTRSLPTTSSGNQEAAPREGGCSIFPVKFQESSFCQEAGKNFLLFGLSCRSKMKGTSTFGKRCNKTHKLCHQYGSKAYHLQKSTCGKCGYPAKHKRKYNWSAEAQRCNATGTGRMRHLKAVYHRFRHGFREETTPKHKRAAVAASESS
ncbi:large ribosomal subunit protein eL37-like [Gorilla gorilla gorilla]|uniref:large ribosomal subunit protein eL37-like n=1 Tax=Gorilla gorilla gorilla TaxID=9595 RepID=UPI002445CCA2|nr:60S ribosomal protein L37-like [Gorilla gorilla gorilla]